MRRITIPFLLVLIVGVPRARAADAAAAPQTVEQRTAARDADWAKLEHLLTLAVIPENDKARWSAEFLKTYWESPGIEPAMAEALEAHTTKGSMRDALEARSLEGKAGIRWVKIPGGSFTMGSDDKDLLESRPEHPVLVKPFQMAKTLVTNKQYKACAAAGACTPPKSFGPGFGEDDRPAVGVDWAQAKAFSAWAGGRLPSEAEWEYAARSAGHDERFPWGNEIPTCETAVFSGCGDAATAPVCSKPAGNTAQGLCDMAGNAWEWVEDPYHDTYDGAPTDGSAWTSPAGTNRVTRGGSWHDEGEVIRSAYRIYDAPGKRSDYLGFRPAR